MGGEVKAKHEYGYKYGTVFSRRNSVTLLIIELKHVNLSVVTNATLFNPKQFSAFLIVSAFDGAYLDRSLLFSFQRFFKRNIFSLPKKVNIFQIGS